MKIMPANPLTKSQLVEAALLKQKFGEWQTARKEIGAPASQEVAAGLLGFNQSALSQYLNGKIPLNVEAAIKFSALLGCAVGDFSPSLAAQASRYAAAAHGGAPDESVTHFMPRINRVTTENLIQMVQIKKSNLRLQAGVTGFETEQGFEDGGTVAVPLEWIEKNDYVTQCLLAIKVKGQSMEPAFFEDDVVVINIADTKAMDREIYAVNYNGEAVIKQLVRKNQEWYLHSFNSEFDRLLCRGGECIIVGKVVWQEARSFSRRR
ncbi:LexA family transcriptional regulator [Oxalobacteraceae bacterium]|nr:LexA family transcriptional regulator [Oxalobacteraceae bacterium]